MPPWARTTGTGAIAMALDVRGRRPLRRWGPPALAALTAVGLALVVAGSFGPWLVSGRRRRSSYQLLQVADRLGFLGSGAGRLLPRTWVFVPLAAALALVAVVALPHRRRLAGTAAGLIGVYALVLGAGVLAAPVVAGWGTTVSAIGGMASSAGGVALVVFGSGTRQAPSRGEGEAR